MSSPFDRSQQNVVQGAADDSPPSIVGLPTSPTVSGSSEISLFDDTVIQSGADQVAATITVSDPTIATLDIPLFDALEQFDGSANYRYTLTSSGLYNSLEIVGTPDAVSTALQLVTLAPVASDRAASIADPITVSVSDGTTETDATVNLVVGADPGQPAYASNTGDDQTGTIFTVFDDPARVAFLDLSANDQNKVVFGGAGRMALETGNTTVVLNGADQTGTTTISSLGGNTIWAGDAPIEYVAGGASRFILGAGEDLFSYVHIDGGPATASNEFDVWGDSSEYQTIVVSGGSSSTVFAGGSNLVFVGGNALIVADGAGQTGSLTVEGTGGNTIWAGTANLAYYEAGGSDEILLTGAASTVIHGATEADSGVTTVQDLGNTGQFIDESGAQAERLFLGGGQNTVFGGAAQQTITMNGSGTLTVADAAGTTGTQSITVGTADTGAFAYWGGGEAAAITLGGGASFIQAGSGNTSLVGGTGSATVQLAGSGTVALSIDGAHDGTIDVFGFSPTKGAVTIQDVTSAAVSSGNLVVSLGDGATATFHGITDPGHQGIVFG